MSEILWVYDWNHPQEFRRYYDSTPATTETTEGGPEAMSGRDHRDTGPGRRTFLISVTAVTATGLTGCLNQGSDDGDGGNNGDGGNDADSGSNTDADDGTGDGESGGGTPVSANLTCSSLTDGYEAHDTGELPVIFDFEYPAVIGEFQTTENSNNVVYTGIRESSTVSLTLQLTQGTRPLSEGSMNQSVAATTEFNGETIEFYGASSTNPIAWGGFLPYEIDGQVRYFNVNLSLSSSGDNSEECREALQTAAEEIVNSMELNPDTTIETEYAGQ